MDNQNINENRQEENNFFLKEKNTHDNNIWYIIIAILILAILGWYGYTSGWFTKNKTDMIPVESQNEIRSGDKNLDKLVKENNAPISNIVIKTSNGFPVQKTLRVQGNLPDACSYLNEPQLVRDGNTFYVKLTTRRERDVCTEAQVPYEQNIGLDVAGLPAGVYTVVINGKQTTFNLEQDNLLDLSVSGGK